MEEKVLPHAVQHVLLFDFLKFFTLYFFTTYFYDSCIFIQTIFFQFFTIKQRRIKSVLKIFGVVLSRIFVIIFYFLYKKYNHLKFYHMHIYLSYEKRMIIFTHHTSQIYLYDTKLFRLLSCSMIKSKSIISLSSSVSEGTLLLL